MIYATLNYSLVFLYHTFESMVSVCAGLRQKKYICFKNMVCEIKTIVYELEIFNNKLKLINFMIIQSQWRTNCPRWKNQFIIFCTQLFQLSTNLQDRRISLLYKVLSYFRTNQTRWKNQFVIFCTQLFQLSTNLQDVKISLLYFVLSDFN